MTNKDYLLMALFDCGTCDLEMIDDVGYDWREILTYNIARLGRDFPASLNTLIDYVIDYGIEMLCRAIENRIADLKLRRSKAAQDELAALLSLCPDDDIGRHFNYLDTYIWFANNGDIYQKYLADGLYRFERGTGFHIESEGRAV